MPIIDSGASTAGKANVDSNFNLMVNTPGYTSLGVIQGGGPQNAGAIGMYSVNDEGTVTALRNVKSPKTSLHRRLRVGIDTLLFNDVFNASAQNSSMWEYIFVTLTASQPGAGTVNFGTVQGTAANHGALMRSYQYFPLFGKASLSAKFSVGVFTNTLVSNEEWRCGFGRPTVGGTAPTEGCWFLLTTAGLFGKTFFNGVENSTAALATLASFTVGTNNVLEIIIGEQSVEFWRNGVLLGTLSYAAANGQPFQPASHPLFMQKICTGSVSNTNTMRVADINVYLSDIGSNKDWPSQLSTIGQNGNLGQNGHTQGKTSLWTNSAAPTAAAASNTTPPFSGLGGIIAILPTLAVSSDGILQSFTNPAPTINITGRNLLVYGISIDSHISVVLSGGPLAYEYFIAYGHTADSLATAETASFATATTHAPRIVPIGVEVYPANAAVATKGTGSQAGGLKKQFRTPLVVRPGERFAICARLGVGSTVTTTGAVTFILGVDAVWE